MQRGDWWSVVATLFIGGIAYFIGGSKAAWGAIAAAIIIALILHFTSASNSAEWPDFSMEWESPQGQGGWDTIKLRNIETVTALNVKLEGFSWPELRFIVDHEVNAIHPGDTAVFEPRFDHVFPSKVTTIGRLNYDFGDSHFKNRKPLEVAISFWSKGIQLEKKFTLRQGFGGAGVSPLICVTPHETNRRYAADSSWIRRLYSRFGEAISLKIVSRKR